MRSPVKVVPFTAFVALTGALAFVAAAAVVAPGCSSQGEGEICDIRATDDCLASLVCLPPNQLNVVATVDSDKNKGRCCPSNQDLAKVAVCQSPKTPSGADAAAPPDQDAGDGAVETSAPSPDAAGGATGDASGDAAGDAARDGG